MELHLSGKTALVTGGSEGIGKAIAHGLAKEGVDVAICARRRGPLDEAAKEIAAATGRKIVPITADLTKDADCRAFIAKRSDEYRSFDGLGLFQGWWSL